MNYLEQIKQRCEKSTKGPWYVGYKDRSGRYIQEEGNFCLVSKNEKTILHAYLAKSEADAEFIAHARTDIPKLLEVIEIQGKALEKLSDYAYYLDMDMKEAGDCAVEAIEAVKKILEAK